LLRSTPVCREYCGQGGPGGIESEGQCSMRVWGVIFCSWLSNMSNRPSIVDYTPKSIAVFGDTKPIKDQLKALGGRFNPVLKIGSDESVRAAGWIFPLSARAELEQLLNPHSESVITSSDAACADGISKHDVPEVVKHSQVTMLSTSKRPHIVDYTPKSIAVFGDTKPIKDQLKALGGRFNSALKTGSDESVRAAGWIFPLSARAELENLLAHDSDFDSSIKKRNHDADTNVDVTTKKQRKEDSDDEPNIDDGSLYVETFMIA
jgi:hypothetical protein